MTTPLPIDDVLDDLTAAVRAHRAAVLVAPTGAGKTTRVPGALADALPGEGTVVMLEPRRLAARAAARRIAYERGARLGDEVGYHVRFDRRASRSTRILVVTEGLFVRMLQDDPFLEGVDAIVFDEFHERHVDGDLAFAMVQRVRSAARPDLAVVVMSATLEAEPIASALGDAPIVVSEGRLHPVTIRYVDRARDERVAEAAAREARAMLAETSGDVLVFLPGVGEIRAAERALGGLADVDVHVLFGELDADAQDAVLAPSRTRKVVLATNVAETSVTIPGITGVVDTGLARVPSFDARVGLDRLELQPICRASADQRAGRAGRTAPGVCVRLWSEHAHAARPFRDEPELRRVSLAGVVLQLAAWGEGDAADLPWLDAPRAHDLEEARETLTRLGALDETITPLGHAMASLPASPRVARLVIEGSRRGVLREAATAAALLSERDPFRVSRRTTANAFGECDLSERVARVDGRAAPPGVHAVRRVRDQLVRSARRLEQGGVDAQPDETALRRALFAAFPDRLARRREPGSPRARMVGGRGVTLDAASVVRDAEFFLCLDVGLSAGGADARVSLASAVEREWIEADARLEESVVVEFDAARDRVVAERRCMLFDLPIHSSSVPAPNAESVTQALAAAAATDLERALDLAHKDVASLRARVACAHDWAPEADLPLLDDEALVAMLPALCAGARSFADLRRVDLASRLLAQFDWNQRQLLERLAPERLEVPSGSHVRLAYEPGRPPVLAVRIQEVFGLTETPRVGGGRVPVLLHLLGPNSRAQQVTDDLASFWANTYPLVRKDLRRRYPKHAWPEDPLSARPERRPGRKRT